MPDLILIDDPLPHVRRITLNRPEKRNALNRPMRREILEAVRAHDHDDDVRVTVIRGAGTCFSAGYDLGGGDVLAGEAPVPISDGLGSYPREVTEGWMGMWDLAKPVIAQVHSYCLAGGSELAAGCDLVYVSDDAQIGYPAVRFGTPDMQYQAWMMGMRTAMEFMLTGQPLTGQEAVDAGVANRCFAPADLEPGVLEVARRIAAISPDVVQINKRTVHRAMDAMGMRQAIRAGTELCSLAMHTDGFAAFMEDREKGLTQALQHRDEPFGDYRTATHAD